MNIVWSVFLGVVQGVTEFLPVSSSGHLVIVQYFIPGFEQPGVFFDVILHLATTFAVLYFFRKKIFSLSKKYLSLLVVGTIPAGIVGFLFQTQLEKMFGDIRWVGIELVITGILNLLIDKVETRNKSLSVSDSFLIGISQAIAIIPGISRSGATIFSAVKLGIDRKKAAEFSFLLSIPAILGANVLQLLTHGLDGSIEPSIYLAGFLAAFVSGFLSISIVFITLSERHFSLFGLYCIGLGALIFIL